MHNFRDSNLVSHFLFLRIDPFFRLNEEHFTFRLQYKHSGTFANRQYEELSQVTPIKKSENVRPHSHNSSENATPSSCTFPLTSYKEVHPHPPLGVTSKKTTSY